jgi:hypothetical protein
MKELPPSPRAARPVAVIRRRADADVPISTRVNKRENDEPSIPTALVTLGDYVDQAGTLVRAVIKRRRGFRSDLMSDF